MALTNHTLTELPEEHILLLLLPQLLLFCSYLQQMVLFVAMAQMAHCHVPDLREASPSTTGHVSHLVQL